MTHNDKSSDRVIDTDQREVSPVKQDSILPAGLGQRIFPRRWDSIVIVVRKEKTPQQCIICHENGEISNRNGRKRGKSTDPHVSRDSQSSDGGSQERLPPT